MYIRAAIFDLDGTLADTIPITVYAVKDTVKRLSGREISDEEILKEFGPVDTELVKMFVEENLKEEAAKKYIKTFEDNFDEYVKPIEGIAELLKFIKEKGLKVGLFTGRGLTAAKIVLNKLGLEEYFDVIIAGESTKKPKPDPEGILLALEKLGEENTTSIYTGDFDVDIKASKEAGVISALALWSSTGREELIELKPDKYFRSPYEFIRWIENM